MSARISIWQALRDLRRALRTGVVTVGLLVALLCASPAAAQAPAGELATAEDAYFALETVTIPDDVVLEVGGLALMPSGDIAAATRRGEIWIVENPGGERPHFRLFARGLHEPLGLAYRNGSLYAAQRGELTRLTDTDGDGAADRFEVVYDWPVSGNYHEYAFGPAFRDDGWMVVSLNLASIGDMESPVPWRGWMLEISPEGKMRPLAVGMRSPAGFTITEAGDLFYAENQGDWIGSGWMTHVERGDFVGQPKGLRWTSRPESPLRLDPEDIPDTGAPMFEAAEKIPELKLPAVWFPHGILGVSTSGILEDSTDGAFGPFAGQFFVGDQGHSKLMRVALERVNGEYQGVVFPFREGFASGVLRMIWDREGTMYVGMTSRGWDATGGSPYGLQRLRWTGLVPFEAKMVHARPDGFEIEFTRPADTTAFGIEVTSFTYRYHHIYGSPVIDQRPHRVAGIRWSDAGRTVRVVVDSLRRGYIYELKMLGIRSLEGAPLLHDTGYYTLNQVPGGAPLAPSEIVPADRFAQTADIQPKTTDGRTGQAGGRAMPSGRDAASGPARESRIAGQKRVNEMPADWEAPDAVVTIGTEPGLRFDRSYFEIAAGARVALSFENDDDMLHNLVVTAPEAADEVADAAMRLGLDGPEQDYVPATDRVLFHTALLQPGTRETIYFTAPDEPGAYAFICTFPGHAFTMRGTLRVR